ncbi:MAG: 2-phospho-L-lactate guanylyltransferase [Ignisphaera sp.]|nr:2-phospho-L-lactate guanylyltransferase [Ignisphaera sp.]MCX8168267.1 2-phospho-L-lactate guanylyltransferase [Ignisphaera sp.]MDW8084865.1 2-phospho-L-lactate guanylyltransferase [Ignisphaera sp.]
MIVAIVPVKDISKAKSRLRCIDTHTRIEIVKAMLRDVLHAYTSSRYVDRTVLVTPSLSIDVVEVVKSFNVDVVQDDGSGQIEAYNRALKTVSDSHRFDAVFFGVADTPFISGTDVDVIAEFFEKGFDVVLTPSIDGGTNMMLQRYPLMVELMHGRNSFQKHLVRAIQKTTRVYIYSSLTTAIDIDTIDDIMMARQLCMMYRRELCRIIYGVAPTYKWYGCV